MPLISANKAADISGVVQLLQIIMMDRSNYNYLKRDQRFNITCSLSPKGILAMIKRLVT